MKCCVWNTALCGTETWALWKVDRKLMKVGAPNRILWRTRFRRGYGSVARQTDRQNDDDCCKTGDFSDMFSGVLACGHFVICMAKREPSDRKGRLSG